MIDLNSADINVLAKKPYLKTKLAKVIIAYRDQHGPFKAIDDLKKIYALDAGTLEKVRPYLIIK